MVVLTPAERRIAVLLVALLALGAVNDALDRRMALPLTPADGALPAAAPPAVVPPAAPPSVPAAGSTPGPRLDLNRASVAELDQLPGIGPVIARRIVEQRERLGSFRSIEDLRAVRGIGPRLLERVRPHVRIGAESADDPNTRTGALHPSR